MVDPAKLTVLQLREHLKSRGLSTTGTKAELVERLTESYATEEKILNSDESFLKDSLESGLDAVNEEEVLGLDFLPKDEEDEILGTETPKEEKYESPKKEIKKFLAGESIEAKVKRAKRFGLPLSIEGKNTKIERMTTQPHLSGISLSTEERKRQRAERFGLIGSGVAENETDILEKRAKRFGLSSKTEQVTKKSESNILQKRVERFGSSATKKSESNILQNRTQGFGSSANMDDAELKKRLRAERFGLK